MEDAKIKITMPSNVKKILEILNENGYEGYIVGGCVRDCILNKKPNDWDICTSCTPKEMLEIFQSFKVIPTGLQHGTITLLIDNESYEVTTYRIDGEYKDGRHPDTVMFTNKLKDDLKRRDFTMNAMAYNDQVGLIDYYEGTKDIFNKKIKCVGNPIERFNEDYLRMLRGIRFSTQLNYKLDEDTFNGIKKLSKKVLNISKERIREELNKILISSVPSKGFKLLSSSGILKYLVPELEACVGFNQHNPHHHEDVFNHILTVVDQTENDLILRLSALFHDIGKPKTFHIDENGIGHFYNHNNKSAEVAERIMKELKYDNESIHKVSVLVQEHMSIYENAKDKAIKRLINRVGIDNMDRLLKLQRADIESISKKNNISHIINLDQKIKKILNKKEPLTIKDLKINGNDLINLGIPKGKQIGIILNELMEIILEKPELNQKENLIEIVEKKYKYSH